MTAFALSRKARADLGEIWRYSRDNWSVAQADRYASAIRDAIIAAAREPERGRSCAPAAPDYFRVAAGSHFVFYRMEPDRIVVVRILHQRMDFMRHL